MNAWSGGESEPENVRGIAAKTTMLNALAGAVPTKERIITCEEVFELA